MTEEFTLHQFGGQTAAVDRNEWLSQPRGHAVNGLRQHFLAYARIAADQYRGTGVGDLLHRLQQGFHGVAFRHQSRTLEGHYRRLPCGIVRPERMQPFFDDPLQIVRCPHFGIYGYIYDCKTGNLVEIPEASTAGAV
jgi:hypothetical protein